MVLTLPDRRVVYRSRHEVSSSPSTVGFAAKTQSSLVDQSMVPFATCYILIYMLVISMLAGNHALPMMLRFIIWLGTKVNETLHFLLDHPRRYVLVQRSALHSQTSPLISSLAPSPLFALLLTLLNSLGRAPPLSPTPRPLPPSPSPSLRTPFSGRLFAWPPTRD